jgi:AmmeMemoRadiSam system protein A/AmmeMemoRadiSam system protein B
MSSRTDNANTNTNSKYKSVLLTSQNDFSQNTSKIYYSKENSDLNVEKSNNSSVKLSIDYSPPISRYVKSLELFDNLPKSLPGKQMLSFKKIKSNEKASLVKKQKLKSQLKFKYKLEKSIKIENNIYTPIYDSLWFETENGLSLEMYLKRLFQIAKDNLSCNLNKDTTKAILVPHAGIKYSGICSASAYYELYNCTTPITRIILLCTHHQPPKKSDGINIISTSYNKITSYRLGKPKLSIDNKTIEILSPFIEINNSIFEKEHSFFNQLPFIETIAPKSVICPLLIGNMVFNEENNYKIREILQILKKLLEKEGTILICSSDLSHINGNFNSKINLYIPHNIRKSDSEILYFLYNIVNGIKTRNNKIDEILFLQNSSACGIVAIYLFGKLLNSISNDNYNRVLIDSSSGSSNSSSASISSMLEGRNYFNSRISCYYTSIIREHINILDFDKNDLIPILDITDTSISSVSYAGVVFTTQHNIQTRKMRKIDMICSEYEKIALLGLAKEQLYYKLLGYTQKNKIPDSLIGIIFSPIFKLNLGVFTTLYKDGKLRGCIGTLETDNDDSTVESNVKKYILETAFRDNRFNKVDISEFNKLEFSITILYTLKPITLNEYFGSKFILGRDGIMISRGKKQGYFLPSVSSNFGYDKQKLLEELCTNKMGNSTKDCFRYDNIKMFFNEGIEFSSR